MATLTRSGYLASASTISWTSGQTLDSLTDNEYTDLSDEIDNSTNKYMFADVEIVLASAAYTGTDSGVEVYVVPSLDGTNYPTWTGSVTTDEQSNNNYFVGFVSTTGTTSGQRMVLRNVELPSGKYKFAFRSRLNVASAASGNSASWRPYSVSV